MCDAELGDQAPVLRVEQTAARHRRGHKQERPGLGADGPPQGIAIEAPGLARRKDEGDEPRFAAGETDAIDQPGVGRVRNDDLLTDLRSGQQHVQDAGQATGTDHAVSVSVVVQAGKLRYVAGRRLAQLLLPDERQIAVVRVGLGGAPRPRHDLGVGWDVDVQVLEAQQVAAGQVGARSHAVDADSRDRLQACRARSSRVR